jgi:hypothetical protein
MNKRDELLARHAKARLNKMMLEHQQEIQDLIAHQQRELAELMISEDDAQRALDVLNIVKAPLQHTANGYSQLADTEDARCPVRIIDRTMAEIKVKHEN